MKKCIMENNKNRKFLKGKIGRLILVCLFWILIWILGAKGVGSDLILPSPLATLKALMTELKTYDFYLNIGWTVFRCLTSMLLAFVLGSIGAVLSYRYNWTKALLSVPVTFFKAVPVMAIIIYIILVIEANWVGVVVSFLMCFPIVYTNLLSGLEGINIEYLELAQVYDLSFLTKLKFVYFYGISSEIKGSLSLISGLSWKAVVAAEVLSVPAHSLGYPMLNSKYYLETPRLFAYIVVIVVFSMIMEYFVNRGLKLLEVKEYKGSRVLRNRIVRVQSQDKSVFSSNCKLEKVTKAFQGKTILKDFSLAVKSGQHIGLIGDSGIGKTTVMKILVGLERIDEGKISIDGSGRFAVLFQEDRLLPYLNVFDNMALTMDIKDRDRILEMAQALEIEDSLYLLPNKLSGGMRHRVALGRTFLSGRDNIILDEPFRGLDKELKRRIIDRLWHKETKDRTLLLITHIREDAESLTDEILELIN